MKKKVPWIWSDFVNDAWYKALGYGRQADKNMWNRFQSKQSQTAMEDTTHHGSDSLQSGNAAFSFIHADKFKF